MKINFILPGARTEIDNQLDFTYMTRLINGAGKNGGTTQMGSMPSALPTLAALTPPDVKMSIIDENIETIKYDDKVDIAAISFLTLSSYRAYEIANEYRRHGVYVVMGGIHASMFPDEALKHADTVVIGEAEETWPRFINDFKNNNPQKIYKPEKKPDLKKPVLPRWDLLKNRYYNTHHVQTTRGCPFDCDFCGVRTYLGKPRYKPVENVIQEIKATKKYSKTPGLHSVVFSDDNIISSREYASKLFKALIPLKIRWSAQCSINIARDDELLDLAQKSGCDALLIGFESISQDSLNLVNKGKLNKAEEYKDAVEKIHSYGIMIFGMMILGLDGDTESVFKDTADFMKDTGIAFPVFNILTPIPGTRLYDQMAKEGRVLHNRWNDYNGSQVCFVPKNMSQETLRSGFYWILKDLYSSDAIFERIEKLWEIGLLKMDKKYNFIRTVLTVRLLVELFFQKGKMAVFIKKIIRELWRKKGINISFLLVSLNFFEYALSLPEDD